MQTADAALPPEKSRPMAGAYPQRTSGEEDQDMSDLPPISIWKVPVARSFADKLD